MKKFLLRIIPILILTILLKPVISQETNSSSPVDHWVDSIMNSMSMDEMIGQLIMVRANNPNEAYFSQIDSYIKNYGIGGVTFFGGKPYRQVVQTNAWQAVSKIPLLISIDAEWGLGMRLDSAVSFPFQMTLGAIRNDSLIYEMGRQVAQQCRRMGIQMNFAPVVDVNSNPLNPVIHMRSFGQDKILVANKGTAYMKGLMENGILVTAKHFPGHGDTDTDSHVTLPVINHDRSRLDSVELYPFRKLIDEGLTGIMVAHLYIPRLQKEPNTPSTLSHEIVTDLLQKDLHFKGLTVTDALDMKGVLEYYEPGEIEVRALLAGNDILLLSKDVPAAVGGIKKAIEEGRVPQSLVQEKCRKILHYKYLAGLSKNPVVDPGNLHEDINPAASEVLVRQMFEEAVTLVKNQDDLIPLKRLDTLSIASVSIGYGAETPFQSRLKYYAPMDNYSLGQAPSSEEISRLMNILKPYNLVILSIQNTSTRTTSNFSISNEAIGFVRKLDLEKKIVLDIFASPYALSLFEGLVNTGAILVSYQEHELMQDISAQAIFGGVAITGRLPVDGSQTYRIGTGIQTDAIRLKYTIPEAVGIQSIFLQPIDSLIKDAIQKKAMPGCQVFAARDGQVFFLKSYGSPTYESKDPIDDFDLYDIASLTKAIASTPSLMRLTEQERIDIDHMLLHYLHYLAGTDKSSIIIRNMMAHQARLQPWIPFYTFVVKDGKYDPAVFQGSISEDFPTRVAENLYIRKGYGKVIMDTVVHSELLKTSEYKYSDLGYYFLKDILENVTNKDLDQYVGETFYKPLGLSTTGYLPRKRFPLDRIVPTEYDKVFRKQLLHGDVHDQGAAMLGGVAGHAGLFSNANDLGIFMQMLLNEGVYGDMRFLEAGTVHMFTQLQNPLNENRRGIGFDKPLITFEKDGPNCKSASPLSYGHSGFTGTYLWADPANGLVYIFLSNRIYPDAENNKLSKMNIRTNIHQFLYDAINKSETFAH